MRGGLRLDVNIMKVHNAIIVHWRGGNITNTQSVTLTDTHCQATGINILHVGGGGGGGDGN